MDPYIDHLISRFLTEIPETDATISVTSPGWGSNSANSGFVNLILSDAQDRERSQDEIYQQVTAILQESTGARAFASQPQSIGDRRGGLPVQYVLQAPTIEKLKEILPEFMEKVNESKVFSFSDINLKFTKPELQVDIDREKARNLGISIENIARTLQLAYAEQRFDYFYMNGKQYQVIGVMQRQDRSKPLDLRSLYVRAENGQLVQLDNLVRTREQSTPPQLYRFNRYVSATVSAGLTGKNKIGDGIAEMDRIAEEVLNDDYSTDLTGVSAEFRDSSSSLIFAFMFALVLIYLVLSAQFESFVDPLIIMFTVPLAIAGALISLWYFDQTLNIFSQIGIIMLIGLVTKNGILIVEFANQRKAHGLSVYESITGAAVARFRPILMTSLSTILGILPIALALGAGSESRVPMGIAVVGGMIFATVLTLFVIPAIYSYFTTKEARVARA